VAGIERITLGITRRPVRGVQGSDGGPRLSNKPIIVSCCAVTPAFHALRLRGGIVPICNGIPSTIARASSAFISGNARTKSARNSMGMCRGVRLGVVGDPGASALRFRSSFALYRRNLQPSHLRCRRLGAVNLTPQGHCIVTLRTLSGPRFRFCPFKRIVGPAPPALP
jgi:hypothetical protein